MNEFGLVDNTPIQEHERIWVKREDLCAPDPGPAFSKYRGVVAHIRNRQHGRIGVLDTYHSKAGWAVAYACKLIGRDCVNFFPVYKAERGTMLASERHIREGAFTDIVPEALRPQQQRAYGLGARLIGLQAGRSSVIYHQAKRVMGDDYMMPNALKLPESLTENAAEAERTPVERYNTVVLSSSSGTIAAGVLLGIHKRYSRLGELGRLPLVVIHQGYTRSKDSLLAYVHSRSGAQFCDELAGPDNPGFFPLRLVDEGYGYKDAARDGPAAPFPCNPYYDLKSWRWLLKHRKELPQPILFWNIGS